MWEKKKWSWATTSKTTDWPRVSPLGDYDKERQGRPAKRWRDALAEDSARLANLETAWRGGRHSPNHGPLWPPNDDDDNDLNNWAMGKNEGLVTDTAVTDGSIEGKCSPGRQTENIMDRWCETMDWRWTAGYQANSAWQVNDTWGQHNQYKKHCSETATVLQRL